MLGFLVAGDAAAIAEAHAVECAGPALLVQVADAEELVVGPPGDSKRVRLAGIDVPRTHAGGVAGEGETQHRARRLLTGVIGERPVCLAPPQPPPDRYGRLLAQVTAADGRWLQGELLVAGLARVRTTPDAPWRADEMLALEAEARQAGRGLWRDPHFRVRPASAVDRLVGSFQIVEGTPERVVRRGDRWYLDFGRDWRSDFSVSLGKGALDGPAGGIDPAAWRGRPLRVRGWVDSFFGPRIEVTHAEQIEVLRAPE